MFGRFKTQPPQHSRPDFSRIDSQAKAENMFRRGELEKLHLMPLEFGGEDNPLNTLYVPIGFAEIKMRIDRNIIAPLVSAGKVKRYEAVPEYQGKSFIPIAIKITASNPGEFSSLIRIWGKALSRDSDS
jgi:hypothetical protein